MLSLYGIMHSGFSKYYNFNYKRNRQYSYRHIYACLFFIADYENLIMYAYLQNELDEEFFQKDIQIKGLKSENGYLVGFDSTEPKQFRNVLILQRPFKIVWGRNNVAPGCDVVYKRLSIREGIFIPQTCLNCLFNIDCELDKSMHTEFINSDGTKGYIKRRLNYPLGLEYSVNEKIKMYNEWIKNNPTYTIEKLFEESKDEYVDTSKLNTKGVMIFAYLYKGMKNAKTIKVCKLNLMKPVIIKGMFYLCNNLSLVDMTKLIGDYPDNYFNCDNDKLMEKHNLKIDNYATDNTTIILPSTTPNFNRLLQVSNDLTYLGKVRKKYRYEDLYKLKAKYTLINKDTRKNFFVIET